MSRWSRNSEFAKMRLHYAVDATADAAYDFRRAQPALSHRVKFTTRAILNQSVSARAKFRGRTCDGTVAIPMNSRSISNAAGRQNYGACNHLLHTAPMSTLPLGGISIIYILRNRTRPRVRRTVTSIIEEEFSLRKLELARARNAKRHKTCIRGFMK